MCIVTTDTFRLLDRGGAAGFGPREVNRGAQRACTACEMNVVYCYDGYFSFIGSWGRRGLRTACGKSWRAAGLPRL